LPAGERRVLPHHRLHRAAFEATTLRALTIPRTWKSTRTPCASCSAAGFPATRSRNATACLGPLLLGTVDASLVRDDQGKILYVVSQVQDISERRELAQRLEYLIDHDFLTGLANRRRFEQELSREAERMARYGAPGAVLVIDLDNFKEVNDTSATWRATTFSRARRAP